MSAPDTNTKTEAERHRGPLTGMAAMVLFAIVLLVGLGIFISQRGGAPEGAEAQQNGAGTTTGDETEAVSDAAAPTVQPETTTGAAASAGEEADTNPTDVQVSTPPGEEPVAAPAADD